MKKLPLYFLLIFFLLNLIAFIGNTELVLADETPKPLEIDYPEIPGTPMLTVETELPDYVKYIFNFLIWGSGFIALGVLVYGGFKYLTSAGNVESMGDAKNQISAAVLGLIILFSSYLLLININPQLVTFDLNPLTPAISTLPSGVLACDKEELGSTISAAWNLIKKIQAGGTSEEEIEDIKRMHERLERYMKNISEHCYHIIGEGNVPKKFNDKIGYFYFIPGKEKFYGIIAYEYPGFKGKNVLRAQKPGTEEPLRIKVNLENVKISSVRPFILSSPESDAKVELYEETDFNFEGAATDKKRFVLPPNPEESVLRCTFYGMWGFIPQSIKIQGNIVVILGIENSERPPTEVFLGSDSNLNDNRVTAYETVWFGPIPYPSRKSQVRCACTICVKFY